MQLEKHNTLKIIDLENWNRKEHFDLFSSLDNPYFGIVAQVKCTGVYQYAKQNNRSFFASYFHRSICAANEVEAFRLRIKHGQVVLYDTIDAGLTIAREDETFGFGLVKFDPDFAVFSQRLEEEIASAKACTGLHIRNEDIDINLIRHSTLPWAHFTGILHPCNYNGEDSMPRITFGKRFEKDGEHYMSVNVEGHHGLMDGLHLCKYLELLEQKWAE